MKMAKVNVNEAALGVNVCPVGSVFNCNAEGLAMTGDGYARMLSALDGIEAISAILFQREVDAEHERGIVIDKNTSVGLLNALGVCTEHAKHLMAGSGGHTRNISTTHADYPALERLASYQRR
jgi:hypothetical protein